MILALLVLLFGPCPGDALLRETTLHARHQAPGPGDHVPNSSGAEVSAARLSRTVLCGRSGRPDRSPLAALPAGAGLLPSPPRACPLERVHVRTSRSRRAARRCERGPPSDGIV